MENLAKIISPIAQVAGPVMQGWGTVSNIIQGQRQGQLQQAALAQQQQLAQLAANPALLSARIRSLQQPLSASLTQDVGNQVQGYLMERGLGLSPNIQAAVLGQALAPYSIQEQQLAQQAAFEPYQIGTYATEAAGRTFPPPANTAGLWDKLAGLTQPPAPDPGPVWADLGRWPSSVPHPGGSPMPDVTPPNIQFPGQPQFPDITYPTYTPGVGMPPYASTAPTFPTDPTNIWGNNFGG
jgi:hypothetical protein